jgi:hypothetical protein
MEPAELATDALTLEAIISLNRLVKKIVSNFHALLPPAPQAQLS